MERLQRQVSRSSSAPCEVLIDGEAFAGDTWNFMETDKIVRIKTPLLAFVHDPTKFLKGFRFYGESKQMYSIQLFEMNNFQVHLCFYNTGSLRLEYSTLVQFVIVSMQRSIENMKGSETWNMLNQSLYPWLVERLHRPKFDFEIMTADFKRFGKLFASHLTDTQSLRQHKLPVDLINCFVARKFGQAQNIQDSIRLLKPKLIANCIRELCLHVAFDCKSPGKTILFGRNNIKQRMGKTPDDEYYPCAIRGAGNYYFKFDTLSFQDVQIKLVKFYSEHNRYVGNSQSKPFRNSEMGHWIVSLLSDSVSLRSSQQNIKKTLEICKKFLKQVQLVERLIEDDDLTNTRKGRIELIVSLTGIAIMDCEKAVYAAWEFVRSKHLLRQGCILEVLTSQILVREKEYLVPSAKLLKFHLQNIRRFLLDVDRLPEEDTNMQTKLFAPRKYTVFCFGLTDYMNVLAAEALVAFFVYGNAIRLNRGGSGINHNYRICADIGIVSAKFKTEKVCLAQIGPNVLSMADDMVNYKPSICSQYLVKILSNFKVSNVIRLDKLCLWCNVFMTNEIAFRGIARAFVKIVIMSSLSVRKKNTIFTIAETYRYHYNARYVRVKRLSVTEFVKLIFGVRNHRIGHGCLLFFVNILRQEIESCEFNRFKLKLIEYVEKELFKFRTALAFPMPQQREVLVIIPVSSDVDVNLQGNLLSKGWEFKSRIMPHAGISELLKKMAKFVLKLKQKKYDLTIEKLYTQLDAGTDDFCVR